MGIQLGPSERNRELRGNVDGGSYIMEMISVLDPTTPLVVPIFTPSLAFVMV
jgi:hypothetical protein